MRCRRRRSSEYAELKWCACDALESLDWLGEALAGRLAGIDSLASAHISVFVLCKCSRLHPRACVD